MNVHSQCTPTVFLHVHSQCTQHSLCTRQQPVYTKSLYTSTASVRQHCDAHNRTMHAGPTAKTQTHDTWARTLPPCWHSNSTNTSFSYNSMTEYIVSYLHEYIVSHNAMNTSFPTPPRIHRFLPLHEYIVSYNSTNTSFPTTSRIHRFLQLHEYIVSYNSMNTSFPTTPRIHRFLHLHEYIVSYPSTNTPFPTPP